jgi:hypothetical protein
MKYQPPPSPLAFPTEAASPVSEWHVHQEAVETEVAAKAMKPTLGFLPPLADRSSHLARARKSRNKKANLGAGAGNG